MSATSPAISSVSFHLTIPGPPQGQGRPRIGRGAGGRPMAFTDSKTRTYAQLVQGEWIAAGRPVLPGRAYRMDLEARWQRPVGHWRRDGGLSAAGARSEWPGKPDLDNVIKGILDALVAVGAVPDDRYLIEIAAAKRWTVRPEAPGYVLVNFVSPGETA